MILAGAAVFAGLNWVFWLQRLLPVHYLVQGAGLLLLLGLGMWLLNLLPPFAAGRERRAHWQGAVAGALRLLLLLLLFQVIFLRLVAPGLGGDDLTRRSRILESLKPVAEFLPLPGP